MQILLIGAGSIGGSVAVLLKKAGYDISIMCRSEETKKRICENGISLHGALGEHFAKFTCYSSYEELGDKKFDVCFIATKYAAMAPCAKSILPYLNEDSLVVGMQNGICTPELAEIVGKTRAVGCMLGYGATKNDATDVTMTSKGIMYIGMPGGYHPQQLDALCEMLNSVLPTEISNDIKREQYSKLIVNSCINATAAITGMTLGKIIDDKRARALFLAIAREGMNVAEVMRLDVPTYGKLLNYKALMLADNKAFNSICKALVWVVAKAKYADVKPSTLQSLERGEMTEVDILNGYFSKTAASLGMKTPVNTMLTEMIHEIERGERKITPDNLDMFKGMLF